MGGPIVPVAWAAARASLLHASGADRSPDRQERVDGVLCPGYTSNCWAIFSTPENKGHISHASSSPLVI
jgi:hypothetical protein